MGDSITVIFRKLTLLIAERQNQVPNSSEDSTIVSVKPCRLSPPAGNSPPYTTAASGSPWMPCETKGRLEERWQKEAAPWKSW